MDLVRVVAPATSANLGPGFDAIGMALDLFNAVEARPSDSVQVNVRGEGEAELPGDGRNLVFRAAARAFERCGEAAPPLRLDCLNRIPLARGLGSSAAAVLAGLLIANRLLGDRLTDQQLLEEAAGLEGHADNVAACLYGGVQVCVPASSGELMHCPVSVPRGLRTLLFVPDFSMETRQARALLPPTVELSDAVFNLGRASLLVAALQQGSLDLLRVATEDALHQRHRQALFPQLPLFLQAALEAGALGACLSGAGSTILCFIEHHEAEVAQALDATAQATGVTGRVVGCGIALGGARVEHG